MDILVRTQATADVNLIIPLVINTGAPDTGATLTVKAVNPDGSENTSFTAPTISEVISSSGVYKLIFPAAAANKLFTLANEHNPYTVLVKTATSGSTGYRAVRVYCVDRLPGEIAMSTEIASIDTLIDGAIVTIDAVPTLAEIEASTVLAKGSALTTVDAVVDSIYSEMATAANLAVVDGLVDALTANLAVVDTVVDALAVTLADVPTLAEIEASTVLAKATATGFLLKCIKNKKKVKVIDGVLYLIIYDDDNTAEILRKAIKDVDGADVADPASGVIAFETKSTV